MKIAFVPRGTGSGHNMRMYSIALAMRNNDSKVKLYAYLDSLQDTFAKMFNSIDVKTINLHPNKVVDYSAKSIMNKNINWNNVVNKFLGPSMFNSEKILNLMRHFIKDDIKCVVSDLDLSAVVAAKFCHIKVVLVTERFNSTITLLSDNQLEEAGFNVNNVEMNEIRKTMTMLFNWCADNADLVLTDCPYVPTLDSKTHFKNLLDDGHAKFIGPIIRTIKDNSTSVKNTDKFLQKYDIKSSDFLIVASIGGTSMFEKDKKNTQDEYVKIYTNLKLKYTNLKMVLIARDNLKVPDGIVCLKYLPDWYGLLKRSNLVIAHPGWITVTEISALKVPAIFELSSKMEYHEWDELIRLKDLGFYTDIGFNFNRISSIVDTIINNDGITKDLLQSYNKVAPWNNGADRASRLILK